MLKINEKVPLEVKVLNMEGREVCLRDFLGQWVVLYFYPKDETPGCTKEACSFRDYNVELEQLGAKVIGVSKDNLNSHLKFKEEHQLNFELWSDPDHELMEAFQVWGERNFMGKKYMGVSRSTFLINPEGMIVKVWEKVQPLGHGEEVLKALKVSLKD